MTCQEGEIEGTHNSLSGEASGAVMIVIGEVGNQEKYGSKQCRQLAISVSLYLTATNEPETIHQ